MVKAMSMTGIRTQFVKKTCLLLLTVIMAAGLMIALGVVTAQTAFADSEVEYDGVKYTLHDNGEATVSGYTEDLQDIIIPDKIKSGNVDYAVTSIGESAFQKSGLTNITIPANVTSIESDTFSGCSNLGTVEFASGSSLKSIGSNAFSSCGSLTGITIPEGVTSIGEKAFYCCTDLRSVIIPEGVTSIGKGAF